MATQSDNERQPAVDSSASEPGGASLQRVSTEIEEGVHNELGRFGMSGRVSVRGTALVLDQPGGLLEVSLGSLPEQWSKLPYDVKEKRCHDLARRLQARRRHSYGAARGNDARFRKTDWGRVALRWFLGLAIVAASIPLARRFFPRQYASAPASSAAASAAQVALTTVQNYEAERAARELRVCRATESRIMRGAMIGPTDVEGWVVELLLFSRAKATPPSDLKNVLVPLGDAADERRPAWKVGWAEAPELTRLVGENTKVLSEELRWPEQQPAFVGHSLTLHGGYVVSYFTEEQRILSIRFASALRAHLGAEFGALYARCAGERARHMGAWFYGPKAGSAAASLLFTLGAYAESPHLREIYLAKDSSSALDPAFCWQELLRVTAPLSRDRVAALVGNQGGMLSGRAETGIALMFPFRDANRAERSSRLIASELGLSAER